ncbi:hypothetical protein SAMN05444267_1007131 [Chryseobacterium polytrichastri]|uniref:Uncharacterized protein n=2 Tax=Chryseobacterium polytrichastri TaxID=1302687 RepID=A0A1M6V432_9FLAO|nr:hypothetical protein SAMN05444267_1007131 [Chryseobacterium polytrichastri]
MNCNSESVIQRTILKYPQILIRILTLAQQFKNFESMRTNIFIIIAFIMYGLGFSQARTANVNMAANSQKTENITAVETPAIGDIKNDIQSIDHNGWYLMNGRAITDLPMSLQKKAITLGFKERLTESERKEQQVAAINAENGTPPKNGQTLNINRSGSVSGRSGSVSGKSIAEGATLVSSDAASNRFIYLGE